MKSIFVYTDYRKYLSDFYGEKKAANKHFSHRLIAQHVGFKSGGHFSQILSGKANISISFIERLSDFLKLNKREQPYFQNMVLFNQARNHAEKRRYFQKMISFQEAGVQTVDAGQYEFYDKWYYTAVRELLSFYPFSGNYEELGKMLAPSISAAEAAQAVSLLERLKLITREESGAYRPTDALITTGYEAHSLCINNFVFNSLELAKTAIDRFDKQERSLSWIALSVSPQGYQSIVEELRESRRRIMNIVTNDQRPDRVYLFNFQTFPLTRRLAAGKGAL